MVTFADTSHYQTVDLPAYKAAGYDRIVMKATGGALDGSLRFADPTFAVRWRQAGQLGLHRVAYHFARNNNAGGDEFAWCWSQIQAAGGMNPGDVLCYDQEDNRGATANLSTRELARHVADAAHPDHVDQVVRALSTGRGEIPRQYGPLAARLIAQSRGSIGPYWTLAKQRTTEFVNAAIRAGVTYGWVYSGKWYLEPAGITAAMLPSSWRHLWISDYTAGQADTAIEVPAGWTRDQFVARQYTDAANLPGIAGTDANRVLNEWLQGGDMPLTAEDIAAVRKAVHDDTVALLGLPGGVVNNVRALLLRAVGVTLTGEGNAAYGADMIGGWAPSAVVPQVAALSAKLDGLAAAVARIAAPLDPAALAAALAPLLPHVDQQTVEAALREVLGGLDNTPAT